MSKKKINPVLQILGEYFWIIGLSLVVVGATKIWTHPVGIFLSGVILLIVGVIIKALILK